MALVQVFYALSEAGQKASLRQGGNGKALQELQVRTGEPGFEEALALAKVDSEGRAVVNASSTLACHEAIPGWYGSSTRSQPRRYDAPPDVVTVVRDEAERRKAYRELLLAEQAASEAKERAEYEADVQAYLAGGPESLIHGNGGLHTDPPSQDPRLAALRAAAAELVERRKADAELRKAAAAAEEELAEARAAEERASWIVHHGSPRLRRCLQEGIECEAAYRDERLATERPGWVWEVVAPGEPSDPRNPPIEAFAVLDEARKSDPAAELVRWTVKHECDEFCDPDLDCPKFDFTGYAAVAEFLGRSIVFGLPETVAK